MVHKILILASQRKPENNQRFINNRMCFCRTVENQFATIAKQHMLLANLYLIVAQSLQPYFEPVPFYAHRRRPVV